MVRKARAGHVAGGKVFGYQNIEVRGPDGTRSHVERCVQRAEADVVQKIFRLCAEGYGFKAIAKHLNDIDAVAPRPRRLGRPVAWIASSVRDLLHRQLYRGEVVWSRNAKCDPWGRQHLTPRPESNWVQLTMPELRIVSDDVWHAAQARMEAARAIYFRGTGGHRFGRPALGNPSKYLLTNLAVCGCCGGPLKVRSRRNGTNRKCFHGCAWYHGRGRVLCTNNADVPMVDADDIVLEALLDEVLDSTMLSDAIDEALTEICGPGTPEPSGSRRLEEQLTRLEQEQTRLVAAIVAGAELAGLVGALREREDRMAGFGLNATAFVQRRQRGRSRRGVYARS